MARPDQNPQNHTSPTWKLNFRVGERTPPDITPWFRTPWQGILLSGYVRGVRSRVLKFSFQNPLSCNRKRHRTLCSNCIQGVMSWVFRPALPLTGGSDSRNYARGFMSANRYVQYRRKCSAVTMVQRSLQGTGSQGHSQDKARVRATGQY